MKYFVFLLILMLLLLRGNINSQWVQVSNGMGNLNINSLTSVGSNIFAGVSGQGVYLSSNNGDNWIQTSLNNYTVSSFAVNGNYLFAGIWIFPPGPYGFYSSTNNGTNWVPASIGNQQVTSLTMNGNNIFAGLYSIGGIYKSTNNGFSWTQTSLNNRSILSFAVNGSYFFAGCAGAGVYLSTDNGSTWAQTSLNNRSIKSLATNGNNVFAGTWFDKPPGLIVSTNNGTSWAVSSLLERVYALIVNNNTVFAGTSNNGVYLSTDNGLSWIQRNEGLGNLTINALFTYNNYIYTGTALGVYRRPLSELTGIHAISNEIPNQFSLSQNYPNPFNPATKIRFQVTKLSFVNIIVFDVLGKEITTLANENLNPGTYETDWDASNFPSGVYFYKLTAENYSQTRKMTLIK